MYHVPMKVHVKVPVKGAGRPVANCFTCLLNEGGLRPGPLTFPAHTVHPARLPLTTAALLTEFSPEERSTVATKGAS